MKKLKLWHYGLMVIVVGLLGNALLNLFAPDMIQAIGMTALQILSLVCDLVVTAGLLMVGIYLRVKHPIICVLILGFAVLIGGGALVNLGMFVVNMF